ncbi:hypothetical protein [Romboutsia sp. MSSM.1001216sp_RTP31141st1_G3_RTP31141_220114]|uniref:hypothetical protein n=1 Tax=unclassified Romboutsia TaxID=2626894 RepID=UPI0031B641BD
MIITKKKHEGIVAKLERDLDAKEDKIITLESDAAADAIVISGLRNRCEELVNKNALAENRIGVLKKKSGEFENIIIDKNKETIELRKRIKELENSLNEQVTKNEELNEDYIKIATANLKLIKKNELITELKRQFKEQIDIACKYSFVDRYNGITIEKHDLKKLAATDIVKCYTLLGLMD